MTQFAAILTSSPENLLIMTAIGGVAGVYFFYRGFRLLQRKRLILNTPASKVRSASMGLVEISGLATGPYIVTSPLRQSDCYYYRSVAWEWKQRGKDSEWVKVAEESLHVPFYLDDDSGKALVDPRGAEMDLHCDLHAEYNRSILLSGPEMPGCVREFLLRHAANPEKRIKVEEYCIKPKNFLFVLGTLSQNPGLDASIMPAWAERVGQPMEAGIASASDGTGFARGVEVSGVALGPALDSSGHPQLVRLSDGPAPQSAAEMTQQQKIAAALIKAGITNPAAWAAAGVSPQTAPQIRLHPASSAVAFPAPSSDLGPSNEPA
jgi:hypothetical protein